MSEACRKCGDMGETDGLTVGRTFVVDICRNCMKAWREFTKECEPFVQHLVVENKLIALEMSLKVMPKSVEAHKQAFDNAFGLLQKKDQLLVEMVAATEEWFGND